MTHKTNVRVTLNTLIRLGRYEDSDTIDASVPYFFREDTKVILEDLVATGLAERTACGQLYRAILCECDGCEDYATQRSVLIPEEVVCDDCADIEKDNVEYPD